MLKTNIWSLSPQIYGSPESSRAATQVNCIWKLWLHLKKNLWSEEQKTSAPLQSIHPQWYCTSNNCIPYGLHSRVFRRPTEKTSPRVKAKGLRTRLTQKGWDQTHTLRHVTVQQNASTATKIIQWQNFCHLEIINTWGQFRPSANSSEWELVLIFFVRPPSSPACFFHIASFFWEVRGPNISSMKIGIIEHW